MQGVPRYPQILADQLTLIQPGEADDAHQMILELPDFQTFVRPCTLFNSVFGEQIMF